MTCVKLPFKDDCIDILDNRKTIVTEENGRKHILNNPEGRRICRYRVDGCLISEGNKCDFMVVVHTLKESDGLEAIFLVELKGSDLVHAIRQIDHVVEYLASKHLIVNSVQARIILSKTPGPAINSSHEIKLKKKLKNLGGNLRYTTRVLEESI